MLEGINAQNYVRKKEKEERIGKLINYHTK